MFKGRYSNGASARGGTRGGKRGGGSNGRGGYSKRGPRGLFADGIWHCECTPRLPAEHFKVKKEGANQGRWFYTCQMADPKRCGFFLWDEDAQPREEAAVLSNSRDEPDRENRTRVATDEQLPKGVQRANQGHSAPSTPTPVRTRYDGSRTQSPSPPIPCSSETQPLKRTADLAGFDDDEDEAFDWPLTAVEEEAMAKAADASSLQTSHKAQKTGIYATPSTTSAATSGKRRLPWLEEPATPTSAKKSEDYLATPSKPPVTSANSTRTLASPTTPTASASNSHAQPESPSPPTRQKDALTNPADSSSSLTAEALFILSKTAMTPAVREALRSALSKHDLKTQGIVKGRDITRLALKAKDAKIAELQAKVTSLEAEREVDRGVVRKLKWDLEQGRESSR